MANKGAKQRLRRRRRRWAGEYRYAWQVDGGKRPQKEDRLLYKHEEEVRKEFAPFFRIVKAPVKKKKKKIDLVIWEIDSHERGGGQDDMVAVFHGEVSHKDGKYFFEPEGPPTNVIDDKGGTPISLRFELPNGEHSDPYEFRVGGDEIELGVQWEFGWSIVPQPNTSYAGGLLEDFPMSRGYFPLVIHKVDPQRDLQAQCLMEYIELKDAASSMCDKWYDHADSFGNAYHHAFKKFMDTLEEQARTDALYRHMAFGVLAAFTGGALSFLSQAGKKYVAKSASSLAVKLRKGAEAGSEAAEAAVETFFEFGEDFTQVLAGKQIENFEVMASSPLEKGSSPDPTLYHRELTGSLRREFRRFKDHLLKVFKDIRSDDKDKYTQADVEKMVGAKEKFLEENPESKAHLSKPPSDDIPYFPEGSTEKEKAKFDCVQNQFELGMWAKWVQSLRYEHVRVSYNSGKVTRTKGVSNPGGDIRDRLNMLGVPDLAKLNDPLSIFEDGEDKERLVQWGARFKPKQYE